jgi:hypothetical protein
MFSVVITYWQVSVDIMFLKGLFFFVCFFPSASLCYEFSTFCLGYVYVGIAVILHEDGSTEPKHVAIKRTSSNKGYIKSVT